jgi:hypothetical protein
VGNAIVELISVVALSETNGAQCCRVKLWIHTFMRSVGGDGKGEVDCGRMKHDLAAYYCCVKFCVIM